METLRTEGIAALELWEVLLGRSLRVIFHEDDQAMVAVCKSVRNSTRRSTRIHIVDAS